MAEEDPQPSTSRGIIEKKSKKNKAYAKSLKELLRRHKRLTAQRVSISTRESRVPRVPYGTLLQTVVRMHVAVKNKITILRELFFDLFREHSESSREGYEVVVTFNAILENTVSLIFIL